MWRRRIGGNIQKRYSVEMLILRSYRELRTGHAGRLRYRCVRH